MEHGINQHGNGNNNGKMETLSEHPCHPSQHFIRWCLAFTIMAKLLMKNKIKIKFYVLLHLNAYLSFFTPMSSPLLVCHQTTNNSFSSSHHPLWRPCHPFHTLIVPPLSSCLHVTKLLKIYIFSSTHVPCYGTSFPCPCYIIFHHYPCCPHSHHCFIIVLIILPPS